MKTVLITGANQGIGLALTQKLLSEGYAVIGTSRSGEIKSFSHQNLTVLKLDVDDEKSIQTAAKLILEKHNNIDILINNAGIGPDVGSHKPEKVSFEKTFQTNVFGLVYFTDAIISAINHNGQILNISSKMGSIDSLVGFDSLAYRMSKSALNMYSKILANRLRGNNIRVIAVHPGWVRTNFSSTNKNAPLSAEESAEGIYKLIIKDIKTGSFWNAETQTQIPW